MKPKYLFWEVFVGFIVFIKCSDGRTNLTFSFYDDSETDTIELFFIVETFTLNASHIVFQVAARTRGWVGLGIGTTRNVAESDIVIGGYNATIKDYYVYDKHGVDNYSEYDTKSESDWSMAHGNESERGIPQTVLTYYRRYKTHDPNEGQDIEITNEEVYIFWSFGEDDNLTKTAKYGGSTEEKYNLLLEGTAGASCSEIFEVFIFTICLTTSLKFFKMY